MRAVIPVAGLLLLAFAGYIKGAPLLAALPDLTFIGAAVTLVATGHYLLRDRLRPPPGIGYVLLLWGAFLFGLVPVTGWTEYSTAKIPQLLTITLLCTVGAMVLLRGEQARHVWVSLNAVLGMGVAALAVAFPTNDVAFAGRLALEGGSTINVGRAIGAAVVILALLSLGGARRRRLSLLAAVALAGFLVWTGSRGPVIAAVIAVLLVAVVAKRSGAGRRFLTAALGVVTAAYMAAQAGLVSDRLVTFQDNSAEARRILWAETWQVATEHPFGVGWGGLGDHLPLWAKVTTGSVQYPHNVFLEVLAEAGWIAGAVFAVVLAVAFVRQSRATASPTEMAMLGLFVFHVLNAMVSADVVGNRGLWVAVGAALVMSGRDADVLQRRPDGVNRGLESRRVGRG